MLYYMVSTVSIMYSCNKTSLNSRGYKTKMKTTPCNCIAFLIDNDAY